MKSQNRQSRGLTRRLLVASACLMAASCAESTELPLEGPAMFAKGGGGGGAPSVDAIDPSNVPQGVTLTMTITGAGFTAESQVSFELAGVETGMVSATSTTLISDTELTASVTVAAEALAVSYDVAVKNGNGPKKKGVGIELLKVDPGDPQPADPEIVFISGTTNKTIRVIDASGANETVVFEMAGPIRSTSWSRDGSQILFSSAPDPHGISVLDVTIGADGQPFGDNLVTIVPRQPLGLVYPSWSPDGMEIALADGAAPNPPSSLWVANVDGTGLTAIYGAPVGWLVNYSTSWSPDGTRIAFVERLEDFGAARIVVVSRATGSVVARLVVGEFYNIIHIDWARTSDRIAFSARYDGRRPKDREYHVYTVDVVDGNGEFTEITKGGYPTWSPDDSEIAFATDRKKLAIITLDEVGAIRTLTATDPYSVNWRR